MSAELVLANVPQQTRSGKRSYVATPYQICKGVNQILSELKLKSIPPQMLYRYASAGKFMTSTSPDGRMQVDRDSFETWFRQYLNKKIKNQH
jgi:hypothetical protein